MSGTARDNDTAAPAGSVLLASNDPEVGSIWAFALRQMGLQATLVKTADEALDRWAREAFDLIIIDVYEPDLDGVGLARQLRAQAVSPILLFTPDREEKLLLQAYQAGVDECVVKPVSPALFLPKVRAWLRRSWAVPARALDHVQGARCAWIRASAR
jgi:DNA-binding response OmpR family regulator